MAPRNNEPMEIDSGSDISLLDDDDEIVGGLGRAGKGKGKGKGKARSGADKAKKKPAMDQQAYTWEASYTRSWETVQEDEAGSLQNAVEDWIARNRRKRLQAPDTAIRRSIIRHLILLIDLSASMLDRDMRPHRYGLALQYARDFVLEWFDQNPLGQIGVVGMRAGVGERVCEMTGMFLFFLAEYIHYTIDREPTGGRQVAVG